MGKDTDRGVLSLACRWNGSISFIFNFVLSAVLIQVGSSSST